MGLSRGSSFMAGTLFRKMCPPFFFVQSEKAYAGDFLIGEEAKNRIGLFPP